MKREEIAMRSPVLAALLLTAPLCFGAAADSAPVRKIHKVAIVNLALENTRAAAVEASVKDGLLKKSVAADSLRTLTIGDKKPADAQELASVLKAQGYDSLLCVGARKTMRITPADK